MTQSSRTTEETVERNVSDEAPEAHATITWLEGEFPGWSVAIDESATSEGEFRPLWIAHRDGHHPQSELTPAKLHTRLSDYLDRQNRREALAN